MDGFFFFSPAAIPWQGVGGVGVGDNWRRLGSGEAPPHGGGGTQAVSPRVSPPKTFGGLCREDTVPPPGRTALRREEDRGGGVGINPRGRGWAAAKKYLAAGCRRGRGTRLCMEFFFGGGECGWVLEPRCRAGWEETQPGWHLMETGST